jgi:hypothetical protein
MPSAAATRISTSTAFGKFADDFAEVGRRSGCPCAGCLHAMVHVREFPACIG